MQVFAIVYCLLGAIACNHGKTLVIGGYPLKPLRTPDRFIAGAGRAEITPYHGVPMGGHGPGGRIARGTWMPLYARAFYFQDVQGRAVAMVSCDLFAVSAGLRAEVLRLVNEHERLEPSGLILSATHTHHGPAAFLSSEAYNEFGGPLPGFDRDLFEFLAARIAWAVTQAITDARDHGGEEHEVALYSGYAVGIQRNRAIAPFFLNDPSVVQQIHNASYAAGTRCPDGSGENCPRYFATDPSLRVLEILRAGKRRGLLVFYAIHPTAMKHDNELYSPDLTGFAMRSLEPAESDVVAGFFNGAEGDVSPDWDRQDREDVLYFGGALAGAVRKLLSTAPAQRSKLVGISTSWTHARQNSAEWKQAGFAIKPVPGAGEVGGAEDGRTVFYNLGFRGEARKSADQATPEQGVKEPGLGVPLKALLDAFGLRGAKPALGLLGVWNLPNANSFPMEFPVARVTLAPVASFAAIPVEATTAVGRLICQSLGPGTILIGLSNEYFGYTASAKEYDLQQYEAGSTELGPREAEGIVTLLKSAKAETAGDSVPQQSFMPGMSRSFGPELTLLRVPRNMVDDDLQPVVPLRLKRLESRIPRFTWTENSSGDKHPDRRHVSLYAKTANQASYSLLNEDRRSTDFITVVDGASHATRTYTVLWMPPDREGGSTSYYFSVETGDGPSVCSLPFRLDSLKAQAPVPSEPPASSCPPK